jgi:hypothetical protein
MLMHILEAFPPMLDAYTCNFKLRSKTDKVPYANLAFKDHVLDYPQGSFSTMRSLSS